MMFTQTPMVTSNFCQPAAGGCGNTKWEVNFSLPKMATTSGWVVQMITRDVTASDGTTTHDQFWEAFYIAAGQMTTNGLYVLADDTYNEIKHPDNTTGTVTVTGLVRFYEGTLSDFIYCDTIALPGDDPDLKSPAGVRRFTRTQPTWWASDNSGASHNLKVMWDCTNGANVRNVFTTPANVCM